jgi:3',5'-nucleoside bisphosphate phosphatase
MYILLSIAVTMKIDTHVHTTCSDGRKTAAEVIEPASSLGIRLLAITDHDTLDAYPGAFAAAERWQIDLVPGMELSTKDEDGYREVHVLGLKVDAENRPLRLEPAKLADARIGARRQMLENVNAYLTQKYPGREPVRFDDVCRRVPGNIVGRPHLAAALLESAKKSGIPLEEEELFSIFRTPGIQTKKACELTMEACIGLIKQAGGVPELAHPCEYEHPGKVMKKFVRLGGDATEICKYRFKLKTQKINALGAGDRIATERRMNDATVALARKHGLKLMTSSDYHGKIG